MNSLAGQDLATDRSKLTGVAEVEVTIVATVTVPADAAGHWVKADAVNRAVAAARVGNATYTVRQVETVTLRPDTGVDYTNTYQGDAV